MNRSVRLLAGTLATLALTAGITTITATTANAALINWLLDEQWDPHAPKAGPPIAYPGMYIDFAGDMTLGSDGKPIYSTKACTMGPVGTDGSGRKIGITAGHCSAPASWTANPAGVDVDPDPNVTNMARFKYDGPTRATEHTTNNYPVFDRNAVKYAQDNGQTQVNPIGWVRWVDGDVCDYVEGQQVQEDDAHLDPCPADPTARQTDLDSSTDYMVIEFAPEVQLTSQVYNKAGNPVMSTAGGGKPFKVNAINTNSSGAPAQARAFPFNDQIENFGAVSARQAIPTTPASGATLLSYDNGMFRSTAIFQSGDSGGPAVMRGTGKWVGIITKAEGAWLGLAAPYWYTSAKTILGDLNDATKYPNRTFGRGFAPVND